jgi:hypothetical protein
MTFMGNPSVTPLLIRVDKYHERRFGPIAALVQAIGPSFYAAIMAVLLANTRNLTD